MRNWNKLSLVEYFTPFENLPPIRSPNNENLYISITLNRHCHSTGPWNLNSGRSPKLKVVVEPDNLFGGYSVYLTSNEIITRHGWFIKWFGVYGQIFFGEYFLPFLAFDVIDVQSIVVEVVQWMRSIGRLIYQEIQRRLVQELFQRHASGSCLFEAQPRQPILALYTLIHLKSVRLGKLSKTLAV